MVSGWTRGHPLRVPIPDKHQKLFSPLFWKTEERIVMSALLWTSPACHFVSLRFSSPIDDIAVAHFLPSYFPFSLSFSLSFFLSFFLSVCLFRATPTAYGSSQVRGQIRATAACLYHSHSNVGSEPHLQPNTAHGHTRSLAH